LKIAQSFSPNLAEIGDKFVAQIQLGRQTRRPAMNFSVTKMQEENKIAQLVFLKQNKFSTISKTLAFLFEQEKPDNQEKTAQFQSH
jgi:hypothetical protein